jgi:hypothetical protein
MPPPNNAVAPDTGDGKSTANKPSKGTNPLVKASMALLVPVAVAVAIPIVLIAAPIAYVRNPFIIKSVRRDLQFVKAIAAAAKAEKKIMSKHGDAYTVADFWYDITATKVKDMEKVLMIFVDKKVSYYGCNFDTIYMYIYIQPETKLGHTIVIPK